MQSIRYSCPIFMKVEVVFFLLGDSPAYEFYVPTWSSSIDFIKILKRKKFTKIRPVTAELSLADRRTDITKLIVAFRNFANQAKN